MNEHGLNVNSWVSSIYIHSPCQLAFICLARCQPVSAHSDNLKLYTRTCMVSHIYGHGRTNSKDRQYHTSRALETEVNKLVKDKEMKKWEFDRRQSCVLVFSAWLVAVRCSPLTPFRWQVLLNQLTLLVFQYFIFGQSIQGSIKRATRGKIQHLYLIWQYLLHWTRTSVSKRNFV